MTDISKHELATWISSERRIWEGVGGALEILDMLEDDFDIEPPCPETIFGRWATHPDYGRALICSAKPDSGGDVQVMCESLHGAGGIGWAYVKSSELADISDSQDIEDTRDESDGELGKILDGLSAYKIYRDRDGTYWRFDFGERRWQFKGLAGAWHLFTCPQIPADFGFEEVCDRFDPPGDFGSKPFDRTEKYTNVFGRVFAYDFEKQKWLCGAFDREQDNLSNFSDCAEFTVVN